MVPLTHIDDKDATLGRSLDDLRRQIPLLLRHNSMQQERIPTHADMPPCQEQPRDVRPFSDALSLDNYMVGIPGALDPRVFEGNGRFDVIDYCDKVCDR